MHAQLLIYAALLAAIACLIYKLHRELTSPLRNIPGPLVARFTKLWYLRSIWKGQAHWENINLHRNNARPGEFYAPIVRLGPTMFSITQSVKEVYGITSNMPKGSWYEGWKHPSPDRWTLFPDADIKRHAETRRKFQSMYSMSSLLHYEPFVEEVQSVFELRLRDISSSGADIDMHHWLQSYAFDVIGSITFGSRFGFLDEGKDIENSMASLYAMMVYSSLVGVYAWAHPFLYSLLGLLPGSGAAGRNFLQSIVRKRIAERETRRAAKEKDGLQPSTNEAGARDFLDVAMDAERDPDKGMTKYNVFMMGLSNIIAGSDTTATSLSSILWHLTTCPEALTSLRKELDQATKEGRMTPKNISFKESQNLPYLQACIKESLRVCAATGLPLWRVVPKGGMQLLGHFFPEGTEIGINIWVAHYDQDFWGADAGIFRPERWIEAQADPERLKMMEAHFMAFGLGSRTCIGRHISMLEICKVIPMIVSQFDLLLSTPTEALKTENFWFVRPTDFKVRLRLRDRD